MQTAFLSNSIKRSILFTKTIISYSAWISLSLFFTMLSLPVAFFPPQSRYDSRWYFLVNVIWSRWFFASSFISLDTIKGLENIPLANKQPAIIIANHSSLLDIPLIAMHLKHQPHIWVSNDYTRIPLFGFLLKRMGIIVKRNSAMEMISVIKQAYQLTHQKNRHLIIFPEGTRHSDGNVHRFFNGFAVLAEKLNRPIVPIAIGGLHKIFPKNTLLIDSSASTVKISIGKPIFFDHAQPREEIIAQTHAWLSKEVAELNASSEK